MVKSSLDPSCLKNDCPVSNMPFLSKVPERIELKQFLQLLESHNLMEPFQSAYHNAVSGCVFVLSLLDLSPAFDTIYHDILITRVTYHFWLFRNSPGLVYLLSMLSHS